MLSTNATAEELSRIDKNISERSFEEVAGRSWYKMARHHAIGRLGRFKWDLDLGIPM